MINTVKYIVDWRYSEAEFINSSDYHFKIFSSDDVLSARTDALNFASNLAGIWMNLPANEKFNDSDFRKFLIKKDKAFLRVIFCAEDFFGWVNQKLHNGFLYSSEEEKSLSDPPINFSTISFLGEPDFEGLIIYESSYENPLDDLFWINVAEAEYLLENALINRSDLTHIDFYGLKSDDILYPHIKYDKPLSAVKIEGELLNSLISWEQYTQPRDPEYEWENLLVWSGFDLDLINPNSEDNEGVNHDDEDATNFDLLVGKIKPAKDLADEEIRDLINSGENESVEFKPSLVFNYKTMAGGIGIKQINAQAICAFLNKNGGYLFIGVSDSRMIQGVTDDLKLCPSNKHPEDYLRLEYDHLVSHFFLKTALSHLSFCLRKIDDKQIIIITIHPSPEPVFLKGQINKEFYLRTAASSIKIDDPEELVNYCLKHYQGPKRKY